MAPSVQAVADGSCGPARQSLSAALNAVSPFFPRDEARSMAATCGICFKRLTAAPVCVLQVQDKMASKSVE